MNNIKERIRERAQKMLDDDSDDGDEPKEKGLEEEDKERSGSGGLMGSLRDMSVKVSLSLSHTNLDRELTKCKKG